jgi:two-component system chemotaxis response regulator CheB
VVLVMHVGSVGNGMLDVLTARSALAVAYATEGQVAGSGIWIAAPGLNVTVASAGGAVRLHLGRGARPHLLQPSIDPLFESAAREFGSGVVGVVLSGFLDDGAEGLRQIKAAGGKAIVQDPLDAAVPDMPAAALRVVVPDAVLPIAAIGPALTALVPACAVRTPASATRSGQADLSLKAG